MRRGRSSFGKRSGLRRLSDDAKRAAIQAARQSVVEVLNGLAEAGPYWRGRFRESWYVTAQGLGPPAKNKGEDGRYNLFNVPGIKVTRGAGGRFAPGVFRGGQVTFRVGNSASYATVAMDLEPGVFIDPGVEPQGDVVRGVRRNDIRGQLNPLGKGPNRRTAPLDWFTTYMDAGKFNADFSRGARLGFRNAPLAEARQDPS